jgi:hypothetical protein
MDEKIIYIIFIVLWLLYSLFGKKKKNPGTSNRQQQPTVNQPEEKKGRFTQLGEILLGEEFYELPKGKPVTSGNTDAEISEELKSKASMQQPFLNEENIIYNQLTIKPEPIIQPEEHSLQKHNNIIRGKFNLKQAIIFSAIINRPYD